MKRNESTSMEQERGGKVYEKRLELAMVGGVAFWATNFATSLLPIAAKYRAGFSISYVPMILVESLLGGLIIGYCVSYSLLRFFERIPAKNPILKSVILSFVSLLIIEVFTILINLSNPSLYILMGAALNVPRFLLLGIVIGYVYDRTKSRAVHAMNV